MITNIKFLNDTMIKSQYAAETGNKLKIKQRAVNINSILDTESYY